MCWKAIAGAARFQPTSTSAQVLNDQHKDRASAPGVAFDAAWPPTEVGYPLPYPTTAARICSRASLRWERASENPESLLSAGGPSTGIHPIRQRREKERMALRPLNDRIIIKRSDPELKTAGGIILPDSAGEKPEQGEVVAVGPGKRNEQGQFIAPGVAVGDRVIFGKYSGQTVKIGGDELLVVREEDLFAVIAQ
jgi:chaperonin GroES